MPETTQLPQHTLTAPSIPASVELLFQRPVHSIEHDALTLHWVGELLVDGQAVISQGEKLSELISTAGLEEAYKRISGNFCLIIVSSQSGSITLVNDHMSMQPCYYSNQGGKLYVSDSLKQIKKQSGLKCTLSSQAIFNYFYFHCIPAPYTIYEECAKLEPAVAITFNPKGETIRQNLYRPDFAGTLDDVKGAQKRCLTITDNAVERQASPDCGAFLSGGLDSSTVAGMLARHHDKAKTFSIGFKAKAYDETEYALITAKHFDTEHKVLYLEPDQAAEEFTQVAQYFDEPFGNSSAMAAYFCAKFAKQNGVTHLLAGDGGDELFAGNVRYAKQKKFELFHQAPSVLQILPRLFFCNGLSERIPVAKKVGSYIRQADIPLPARLETYNFINQFGAQNIFSDEFLRGVDTSLPLSMQEARYNECPSDDTVNKMLYLDWKFTLADNDLVKVSKMCELAGVKVSYPLLDKGLVDFSATIPADIKLPGYELRDFYKNSCKGFLADETLTKSKHGFGLPFGVWMKENRQLHDLTHQCLEDFKARGILAPKLVDQALEAHETVNAGYYGELIWIIVVLELWLQGQEN